MIKFNKAKNAAGSISKNGSLILILTLTPNIISKDRPPDAKIDNISLVNKPVINPIAPNN